MVNHVTSPDRLSENETGIQFRELHMFFVINKLQESMFLLKDKDVSHVQFKTISNGCQFSLNDWGSIKTCGMIFC